MWVKVAKHKAEKFGFELCRLFVLATFPLRARRWRVCKPVPPQRGHWEHWEGLRVPGLPHSVCTELAAWWLAFAGQKSFPQKGLQVRAQKAVN